MENKSAVVVSREVFALIDWISTCKQIQAFNGAKINHILSDQGSEFVNQEFETHARMRELTLLPRLHTNLRVIVLQNEW